MNLTMKIEGSLGIQHLGNPLGQNCTDYHMFLSKQYEKGRQNMLHEILYSVDSTDAKV